jgi:shikimate dehydrogenase
VTTLCAVLGHPVGHSRSPAMHNAAFRAVGLDWRYEAIDVVPERFEALVRELPAKGYAGVNVTIPHKLLALEVADSASDVARAVGAANTLVFRAGRIEADNTDAEGFRTALAEAAPGAPAGMTALVLGAGGAARAVVHALLGAGARHVEVWNRHPERARALVSDLADLGPPGALTSVATPDARSPDLIVNATSVGMNAPAYPKSLDSFKELDLSADDLRDRQLMVDLVYRDSETDLVRAARARGLASVDGLEILVHQGAASFELWTGTKAPLKVMRDGARHRERTR